MDHNSRKQFYVLGKEGELIRKNSESIVRLGLVGCGAHSYRNILPSLNFILGAKLVATCDLNKEKARLYAKKFGAEHYYTDVTQMINEVSIDAVLMVVGFDTISGKPRYSEIAPSILESEIPVWMEKPPAESKQIFMKIVEACNSGHTFVQVGFKMMFAPAVEKTFEIVRSSEFGSVHSFMASYAVDLPKDIRNLTDPASRRFLDDILHILSQIQLFFGKPEKMTFYRSGCGDGFAVFEYGNKMSGVLHLKGGARIIGPAERIEIIGDGCILILEGGTKLIYHQKGDPGSYGRDVSFVRKDGTHSDVYTPELRQPLGALSLHSHALYGYINELEAFIEAILSKEIPVKAGLKDTISILEMYDSFSAEPGKDTFVGVKARIEPYKESYTVIDRFSCPKCGGIMSNKDGWNAVCTPSKGCGFTAPLIYLTEKERLINKKEVIRTILELSKEKGVVIDRPIVNIYRSGGIRKEVKRLFVEVTPSRYKKICYIAKIPINEDDSLVLREYDILSSNDLSPFFVPIPVRKIFNKGFIMEYIYGNTLNQLIEEQILGKGSHALRENNILQTIVDLLVTFHSKKLIQKRKLNVSDQIMTVHFGGTHNDFDPFNIIIETEHQKHYVIDWEDYLQEGLQEFDIIHFILMLGVIYFKLERGGSLVSKIISDCGDYAEIASSLLSNYCSKRNIKPNDVMSLVPLYAENQIERLKKSKRDPSRFLYEHLLNLQASNILWL